MNFKNLLLVSLIILLSGCSLSSLNPFSKKQQIYYIEGEDIEAEKTVRSGSEPIKNPDDGYTSKARHKKKPKGGYASKVRHTKKPIGGYTSKARHRATMKNYVVRGRVYHPTYVRVGDKMAGVASWYGPNFHGLETSNGEQYNMYSKTVAHKTWPMDTMVKITNLDNGKSAIARINDRGPFVSGRVVDCSYAVGKEIGIDKKGICNVKLEVVGFAGKVYKPEAGKVAPKVKLTDFGVQVGAFVQEANAKATKAKYLALAGSGKRVVIKAGKDKSGRILNRVHVMGFGSKEEALDFIRDNSIDGGFVIRD